MVYSRGGLICNFSGGDFFGDGGLFDDLRYGAVIQYGGDEVGRI